MKSKQIHLTLANDLKALPSLCQGLERVLSPLGLDKRVRYQLEVAIEEVFTNIVAYAFSDNTPHAIEIRLNLEKEAITIRFEDHGQAFNPLSTAAPDLSKPLCDRHEGGLGIHMIKTMMDEIRYQRQGGKNILILKKKRSLFSKKE
ncbi:ATP-binding protein [Desulfosarcina ovata]|nr:ATP-binding protein [Desulfosarcina ovata]